MRSKPFSTLTILLFVTLDSNEIHKILTGKSLELGTTIAKNSMILRILYLRRTQWDMGLAKPPLQREEKLQEQTFMAWLKELQGVEFPIPGLLYTKFAGQWDAVLQIS